LPCVRNTVRYIEHLGGLGYSSSNIQIVLNRYSKKGPLSDDQVEKALKRNISWRIPNSYDDVMRAINAGTPITSAQKSDFGAAIQKWAQELMAKSPAKPQAAMPAAPRSVLGLFGR